MSWKVYKWDGRFIQGELISSHSTESAALKKAEKVIKHSRTQREENKKEVVIWLDSEEGVPLGAIVKRNKAEEIRGRKRIRQSKKKE